MPGREGRNTEDSLHPGCQREMPVQPQPRFRESRVSSSRRRPRASGSGLRTKSSRGKTRLTSAIRTAAGVRAEPCLKLNMADEQRPLLRDNGSRILVPTGPFLTQSGHWKLKTNWSICQQ